jgi:hypothetical protein
MTLKLFTLTALQERLRFLDDERVRVLAEIEALRSSEAHTIPYATALLLASARSMRAFFPCFSSKCKR